MRWIPVVVVVAACGDVKEKQVDARMVDTPGVVDTPTIDTPPPRCNPNAPFGTPTAVTELNTAMSDEAAWLTADELTVYFSSTRTGTLGGYDIFMATRSDRDAAWANITPVAGVNATGNQRFPIATTDGLTMYGLTGAAPNYQIGVATRPNTSSAFTAFGDAPTINSTNNDEFGSLTAGAFYFCSDRSGNYDLYRAPYTNGQFGTPLAVSGTQVNTADSESNVVASPDELTLYFSTDRAGGVGSYDIWMAKRANVADGFGAPVNLQSLNTTNIDVPTWISADGCVLYILRGATANYDIFVAKRGM